MGLRLDMERDSARSLPEPNFAAPGTSGCSYLPFDWECESLIFVRVHGASLQFHHSNARLKCSLEKTVSRAHGKWAHRLLCLRQIQTTLRADAQEAASSFGPR